jgi:hypothetical protein
LLDEFGSVRAFLSQVQRKNNVLIQDLEQLFCIKQKHGHFHLL